LALRWRYDRGCGFDAIGGADHALRGEAVTTIAAVNITATVTVAKMKPTSFKPVRSVIVIPAGLFAHDLRASGPHHGPDMSKMR
jgi:hypothetical protein